MNRFNNLGLGVIFFTIFSALVACNQQPTESSVGTGNSPSRSYNETQLADGQRVFVTHCAKCHGVNAEGDALWRKMGDDGKYPPPPLNGTGHAWHHSRAVLKNAIENGSKPGQGNMPGWKDKLSSEEIENVISWFQSKWSDQVYDAWYEMQQRGNN